ncbi:hypothetical protein QAD02_004821 [Eretmocerus hayati]|uniref:Uncharacterized protein n=1 Tax=Eretmocerus hayati TaxID=131215 RepID=A0ACC2NR40_9HYME|nr:hypothetical protein QAD02_004821 [Eretmocerus hayati]
MLFQWHCRILKERFEELSFESAYYFVIDLQDSAAPLNQPEPALEAVSSNPQNPAEVLASKRKDFAAILYYPHKKATKNQNAINAGGCLYEKYLNKRGNYIKIGIILKEDVLSEDLVPQEQKTDLDIVRKGNKPKGVILRLWKTTFLARGAAKDLTTQYELYAPLSSAYGHELWCIDYGLANPNGVNFQGLFNNIIPFIIEIAKEKNRFDESLELLESRGQDHLAALLSLPKLLGVRRPAEKQATKGQKRKRSAHNHRVETPVSDTTPTFGSGLQDITDSFVYKAKNPLEFQAFKNKRKEDSIKNKRPIGPFVTLVGDYADEGKTYDKEQVATESSVDDETQVELFVTVNFIDYKIESNKVLEAVDYFSESRYNMGLIDLEQEMLVLTLSLYNTLLIPRNVVQTVTKSLIDFTIDKFANYLLQQMEHSAKLDTETLTVMKDIVKNAASSLNKFETERKRFDIYKKEQLLVEPVKFELLSIGKRNRKISAIALLFPIFFGHDDFTAGNGMGTHAEKTNLGDVFVFLPGFPPHIVSKLSSIFLVDLFFANNRKTFGNDQVFSRLIAELNALKKNGLNIHVNNQFLKVYFHPCLPIGDNKGLNEDLGFDPSFNSGRPCRICRATIHEIRLMNREKSELLRTRENYKTDCQLKSPSETGVVEECIFNKIEEWDVTDCTCEDLMHDCFEGYANTTLANICYDLIYKDMCFDLDYLNQRIDWLNSYTLHISNAIPLIKENHLTAKRKLKMSAAEMINFSRYFGLLVADKMGEEANETSEAWSLYILLRKIIDILLSPRIVHGHLMKLEYLIPEFLSSYIALYGELHFKFHTLVHIIRMLKKYGPLIYYWAMRLEAKHRELKIIATTTSSSVNLLHTISLRNQLRLAHLKLTGNMCTKVVEVEIVQDIDARVRATYFSHLQANTAIHSTDRVTYKGIEFNVGKLIVTIMGDSDTLRFGLIKDIVIVEQDVFLLLQPHTCIYFDEIRYAYHVVARDAHILEDVKNIPFVHPCPYFNSDNSLYVVPKYIL